MREVIQDRLTDLALRSDQLTADGKYLVISALKDGPVRRVGDGASASMSGFFYSRKNRVTVYVESMTELRFCMSLELDREVLGYIEQPMTLNIHVPARRRKKARSGSYTPDFLVFYQCGEIRLFEVKTSDRLESLCFNEPEIWKNDSGKISFAPGEQAARDLGIGLSIYAPKTNKVQDVNLEMLWACMANSSYVEYRYDSLLRSKSLDSLKRQIGRKGELSLAEAKRYLGLEDYSLLIYWLAHGLVDSDWRNFPLIFSDDFYLWDGTRECIPHRKADISTSVGREILGVRDPEEQKCIEEAMYRYESGRLSRSTKYRWKKKIKDALCRGEDAESVILPQHKAKGNRNPRLCKEEMDVLISSIKKHFLNSEGNSYKVAYLQYLNDVEIFLPTKKPISITTFKNYCNSIDFVVVARARGGRRLANSVAPSVASDRRRLPASLPFMMASIDHWIMDSKFIVSADSKIVVRPILTVLVDHATLTILAWCITLSAPSVRNVSLVFRHCVRKWGHIPLIWNSDQGAEFLSRFMRDVLGGYESGHLLRPPANGRFGSEVEGTFDRIRNLVSQAIGGLVHRFDKSRSFDRECDSNNRASVNLAELCERFSIFVGQYNSRIIGSQSIEPVTQLQRMHGDHPYAGIKIDVTDAFYFRTAIDIQGGAKVTNQGILHKDHWYNSDDTRDHIGERVPVRFDPEDHSVIYARLGESWKVLKNRYYEMNICRSSHDYVAHNAWMLDGPEIRKKVKLEADRQILLQQRNFQSNGEFALCRVSETSEVHAGHYPGKEPVQEFDPFSIFEGGRDDG
jgi:hypothetical protein